MTKERIARRVTFLIAVAAASAANAQPANGSWVRTTAPELYAAYHDNEVAADQTYKGKSLRIRGMVVGIAKDVLNHPYVSLAGSQFGTVHLQFGDRSASELAKLHRGMNIEVTCRGDGMIIGIPVLTCGN
ncbi:OB-fold protein [Paraburkholderia phenoliruptrix]|uniref:OB-fold protein n=1 Tax=Paraburkholderia phenoliruptrix TaxID=252970 RepID=UPI001C6F25EF|nr:OB-fold putative lipoprotein [Paraburkholderia phenoliruptrix]MBW9102915.1 hypothetical protein [Paraburkholderia phenoliruptrix]MBW9132889.1 hypothetical protein [Paraburkholderia ginsengiterrae]